MAKREIPEVLKKFVIDNRDAQDLQASLKDVTTDFNAFTRAAESAANALSYFETREKRIATSGKNAGLWVSEIITDLENAKNVEGALRAKLAEIGVKRAPGEDDTNPYNLRVVNVPVVSGTKKLAGKEAYKEAEAQIKRRGGEIWRDPTKANPDRVRFYYPFEQAKDDDKVRESNRAIFKQATAYSKTELAERKAEEDARQKKLEEANQKHQLREIARSKKEKEKTDKILNKEIERAEKEEAREEARKKKQDKESKEKSSNKTRLSDFFKRNAYLYIITRILEAVFDVAKKILIATLNSSAKAVESRKTAQSNLLSLEEKRRLDIFDRSKGVRVGTSVGAVSSIMDTFAKVQNISAAELEPLSYFLKNSLGETIDVGLGKEKPMDVLSLLLDRAFETYTKGTHYLTGEKIGSAEARALTSAQLRSFSPDIAELFNQMTLDYELAGEGHKFNTYYEWLDATQTNRGGITSFDLEVQTKVGQTYNEILGIIEDLKENFLTKFSAALYGVLKYVKDIRFGTEKEMSISMDKANREANIKAKEELENKIANEYTVLTTAESATLRDITEKGLTRHYAQFPGVEAPGFKYDVNMLARIGAGGNTEQELLKEYLLDKEGFAEKYGIKNSKDIADYVALGLNAVLPEAYLTPSVADNLILAEKAYKQINAINEENEKFVGSGIKAIDTSELYFMTEGLKDVKTYYKDAYVGSEAKERLDRQAYKFYMEENYSIKGKEAFYKSLDRDEVRKLKDMSDAEALNYLLESQSVFEDFMSGKKAFKGESKIIENFRDAIFEQLIDSLKEEIVPNNFSLPRTSMLPGIEGGELTLNIKTYTNDKLTEETKVDIIDMMNKKQSLDLSNLNTDEFFTVVG